MIASVDAMNQVTGVSPGITRVVATFEGHTATAIVDVNAPMGPTISSVAPNRILVGSGSTVVMVSGTNFVPGSVAFIDGQQVATRFMGPGLLRVVVPSSLLTTERRVQLIVSNPPGPNGGDSQPAEIIVGNTPNVTSYAPRSVPPGTTIAIVLRGTGLLDLAASAGPISVVAISESGDGTAATVTIAVPNIMPGPQTMVLSNGFGRTTITIDVLPATRAMDLNVTAGMTVPMSGTNVFRNVIVQTGGVIAGSGTEPLVIIATGNITIRGAISANGQDGSHGFTNPAGGGSGGTGAGGGGAGADGNTSTPASGGAGAPPGENGVVGRGAGTPAGDGGGAGGGQGASGGCGQAGGGGGLGGSGGAGGGDQGVGTGGAGGPAGSGSNFGAGTGGGGGSTCGNNSGGGGGGGGGLVVLQVATGGTLLVDGTISAIGGRGGNAFQGTGAGGGASGGRVELHAPNGIITINDTISVRGGAGGDSDFGKTGGGGGGGIIVVDAGPNGVVNPGFGVFDVSGGAAGGSLGGSFQGVGGTDGLLSISP
jgi:hypothetical protein